MSRDARWQALLELLVERGRLDVEAAAQLAVSAATIRRDFDQLAEQQLLVRTRGGAATDEAEASINRLLCERAERVIVAADSSKLGHRAFARICPAGSVDTLVTDRAADRETVERFEEAGVEVVAV